MLLLGGCSNGAEADGLTIAFTKEAYQEAKARGVDMRQDVDDEPENECEAFRSGEADHFVELDPEGEFIRSG